MLFISLAAVALTLAVPPSPQHHHVAAAPAAADAGVRVSRVRLKTGVELQVAQRGPVDGAPVLFLHGYTDSWFSFTTTLDHLPPTVRAIVPTQRGHGDSERPECCYRVGDFAADAVALLDALGVARATVVGHSMGSFVAQRIASEWPGRVNRLVLIGSGTTPQTPPVLELNRSIQKLTDPVDGAFVREFQEGSVAKPVPSAFLDRAIHESEKVPARVWRAGLAALLAPDAVTRLDRIDADTLIVWGDKDALFTLPEQEGLTRGIRRARLLTYRDVGHSPQWEEPARFARDLMTFLAPADAARTAPERQEHAGHAHGKPPDSAVMPLLPGLGTWHRRVTTTSAEAQRYFDQGLRLTFAFNHDEAERSLERALELDPDCAMCHWGLAYAIGPNINLPMDPKVEPRALAAIQQAVRLKGRATAVERALIDAAAARFGEPAGAARAERDAAYAAAMRRVARRFPADADIQVLFADAMLNLRPWNQWTRDGRPQPGTIELVAALARVVTSDPSHAGACHFYIHAVEASDTPDRALPCAQRLPRLMPGAGHVVHMPAHVYLRVGRYEEAARANIAAVEADNKYFAVRSTAAGIYPTFYAPHNLHFLWATYMLSGQREKALLAARTLTGRVDADNARSNPSLEGFLPPVILTLARFGSWDAVLAEPAPPADLRYATGMWHYARGLAFAAKHDLRAADDELAHVRALAADIKEDVIIILNRAPDLLKLAAEVLAGEIAAQKGSTDDAVAHLRKASAMEDALTYDEPPAWYHSVRNRLGETLLAAGRPAEAATAFREDLRYVRETGWSLSGLERALRAQGKTADADNVARRFKAAWRYADVPAATGGSGIGVGLKQHGPQPPE